MSKGSWWRRGVIPPQGRWRKTAFSMRLSAPPPLPAPIYGAWPLTQPAPQWNVLASALICPFPFPSGREHAGPPSIDVRGIPGPLPCSNSQPTVCLARVLSRIPFHSLPLPGFCILARQDSCDRHVCPPRHQVGCVSPVRRSALCRCRVKQLSTVGELWEEPTMDLIWFNPLEVAGGGREEICKTKNARTPFLSLVGGRNHV